MYYQQTTKDNQIVSVLRHDDETITWSIPFDPANTDYQQFKVDVTDGVPLEDPDGNTMTQEEVDDFLKTIPQVKKCQP